MSYKDNYVFVMEGAGRFTVFAKQGEDGDSAIVAVRENLVVAERIATALRSILRENTDSAYVNEQRLLAEEEE